jgi:hypothetical protein
VSGQLAPLDITTRRIEFVPKKQILPFRNFPTHSRAITTNVISAERLPLCGSLGHPPCLYGQYLNLAAVLRSRRQTSKSGCALTTRIIDSIAAIITPGSISPSVHSRNGSRGVGKLSEAGSSQVADTSFDLAERSWSTILRNNRPQLGIFKISIRDPKKTDYVLPVDLGGSSSRVARGVEFESNKAKSVGNSNLAPIQHLLVCGCFDTVEGLVVNDHQIGKFSGA